LLIMENGGMNLCDFAKSMENKPVNPENQKIMEAFWIECHRLFLGLSVFLKENIMHHDLKGQNIVYNPETNRAAFIDFGLMRPLDSAKSNILLHNTHVDHLVHWSYPVETQLYNKKLYRSQKYKQNILHRLNNRIDSVYDIAFLNNVLPSSRTQDTIVNRKSTSEIFFYTMNTFLESINDVPYAVFLDKSLETFDLYGMCMGLMYVFIKTFHLLKSSKIDYLELYTHLLFCIRPDTNSRSTVEEALIQYETRILESILMAQQIVFINHIPTKVDGPSPSAIRVSPMDDSSLEISIEQKDKQLLKKICPPGKITNPLTGRCVKECGPNQQRDAKFRCKTARLPKYAKPPKPEKVCPEGKELNLSTNRCVNKCKENQERDANFRCKTVKRRAG